MDIEKQLIIVTEEMKRLSRDIELVSELTKAFAKTNKALKELYVTIQEEEMEDLMHALFNSVKAEADRYLELSRNDTDPTEREIARQRYVVLYEQLEKCGFADEYNAWEWGYEEE